MGALIGLIMNILIMFYVDFIFASFSLFAEICIFIYLIYRNSNNTDWGDVGQSVMFHQIRKYLLELNKKNMDKHSKLWRPSILLLVDNHQLSLIDFCNNLKKGGLYIIGSVLNAQFLDNDNNDVYNDNLIDTINAEWISFIHRNKIKAFPQIAIASNRDEQLLGYRNLLSLGGLGPMKINTVVLPLCELQKTHSIEIREITLEPFDGKAPKLSAYDIFSDNHEELIFDSPNSMQYEKYMKLLRNILSMNKNIVITHNFQHFNYNLLVSKPIQNHFNVTPNYSPQRSPLHRSILNQNILKKKKMMLPDTKNKKWIDIWLFVDKYSFDVEHLKETGNNDFVFPMLMMQFAHILSINKVWKTNGNIRVLLLVQKHVQECHENGIDPEKLKKFKQILQKLRLNDYVKKIETIILPNNESYCFEHAAWFDSSGEVMSEYLTSGDDDNEDDNKNDEDTYDDSVVIQQRIERYFHRINDILRHNSDETYFTFISLPDFSLKQSDQNNMTSTYIQSLHILTKDLPPTALIKCGQNIPVISVDI